MPSEVRQVLPSDLSKPTIFMTIFIVSNTQREHAQTANNTASFKTSFTGNITKAGKVNCNTFYCPFSHTRYSRIFVLKSTMRANSM